MDASGVSADQPMAFPDTRAAVGQRILGLILLASSFAWLAFGHWLSAAIVAVAAAFDLVSSGGRVTIDGAELRLHATLHRDRRIPIAEIARIEPSVKDSMTRGPRVVLRSGEMVSLTPFLRPTMFRSRRWVAGRLAEFLGLPAPEPFPVFRLGWFACAAMIAVAILFGIPLFLAGAAEIIEGSILTGAIVFAIGAVLCAGGVWAVRAQLARRAEAKEPAQVPHRV